MRPFVALAAMVLFFACDKGPNETSGQGPSQTLTDFSMDQSRPDARLWHLNASQAVLAERDQKAHLDNPRMIFYKDNRPDARIKSETGLVDTRTHDVLLSSSVVAVSLKDDNRLFTEKLLYSAARHEFLSDQDVRVVRPSGTTLGRGFEASEDLSDITVFNQKSVVKSGRNP